MSIANHRVNLLPENLWLAQIGRQRRRRWFTVLALSLVSIGLVWGWSYSRTGEIERLDTMLTDELSHTRQEQKQSAVLAARIEILGRRQAALDAMRAKEVWSTHLSKLALAVPDQVVLKRIHTQPLKQPVASKAGTRLETTTVERTGSVVCIEGFATDHLVLATFLRHLQESRSFREVNLVKSATPPNSAVDCLDFGITCLR
ncbi:MAG: PilN domain-containing protein [Planctomycetota bacterium]